MPTTYIDVYTSTYTFTGGRQMNRPNCYVPPECTLALSATTIIVAPTERGGDDGSITAAFTSTSGNTCSWYLNNVDYGDHLSPYQFTGLTAGNYQIYIEQSGCTDTLNVIVPEGEFRTGNFFVSTPQEVSAVENPIILQLQTALTSIDPKYSINTFTISGNITGTTIEFNLTYPQIYKAVFQSKGYPDRSNYFLNSLLVDGVGYPKGTNSNVEICTSLAEALQADSLISRLYFITNDNNVVTLQSREYGDMYDLTTDNVSIVGGGITLANTVSGQVRYDGQLSSDYSVYAELYINPTLQFGQTPVLSNFKRVAELELPFQNNNLMSFDLSTVLKNFVSSPKIDFTFTGFTTLGNMDTNYFCKYGEKYPLIENTNTKKKRYKGQTDVLYALNSALDFEAVNDMSTYLGNPITSGSSIYTGVTFLNSCPNPKYIPRGSKEFLYMLMKTNYPATLELRGDIYYWSAGVAPVTGVTFFEISNLTGATNYGGVTILACGYSELGLSAYEASGNTKISRVDFAIWQTDSGGTESQLTETRTYLLEIDEQPTKFNVAWCNKLGTYSTFSFVGEVIEGQEVQRETYQSPYEVNSFGQANSGFQYNGVFNTMYTKTWIVNSGTIDETTYYFLQDLLASNKIYNYGNQAENFLTIINQQASKSSNDAEYTVQITFRETIFENNIEN